MNAFQLYNENHQPCGIWACGECRSIASKYPQYTPDESKDIAELCCQKIVICKTCGNQCERRPWDVEFQCRECERKDREERERKRLEKLIANAVDVTGEYNDPVYVESFFGGDMGEGFFSSMDIAGEYIVDSFTDDDGGYNGPEWAFACESRVESLDIERCVEILCDDGYEDMASSISIPQSLTDAVKEFNEINKAALTVWEVDYSRKIKLRIESEVEGGDSDE